jgi:hypothetical protein
MPEFSDKLKEFNKELETLSNADLFGEQRWQELCEQQIACLIEDENNARKVCQTLRRRILATAGSMHRGP